MGLIWTFRRGWAALRRQFWGPSTAYRCVNSLAQFSLQRVDLHQWSETGTVGTLLPVLFTGQLCRRAGFGD